MRIDSGRWCKDCVAAAEGRPLHRRPTYWPGPRCTTHHRIERKRRQIASHGRMVAKTYGISAEQYSALYEAQGGRCALCRIATGKARRLAVEHDHATGQVFGLTCGPCNLMLGRLGRRPEPYIRVLEYLHNPPAMKVIGWVTVPSKD
jgi:hypothetical protein